MSNRTYIATRHPVSAQHTTAPTSFLDQLIDAIDPLPDDVFAENLLHDIYAVMKGSLGPYSSLLHRKAVMCEVLRVQAAFESDWNWNEGVDINNLHSTPRPTSTERKRARFKSPLTARPSAIRPCNPLSSPTRSKHLKSSSPP